MNQFTESILREASLRDKTIFQNYLVEYANDTILSELKLLFPLSGNNSFYILDVNSEWDISNTNNNSMKWKVYFPIDDVYTKVFEIESNEEKRFTVLLYDGIIYAYDNMSGFMITDVNALRYREKISSGMRTLCGIMIKNLFLKEEYDRKIAQIKEIYSLPKELIYDIIEQELGIHHQNVLILQPYRESDYNDRPIEDYINTNHFTYKATIYEKDYEEINNLFIKHTGKPDEKKLVTIHHYYQGKFLTIGNCCFTSEEEIKKIRMMRRMVLLHQNSIYGKTII